MTKVRDTVKVKGVPYRVVASRHAGALNSAFWGKFRYLLQAPDGSYLEAFGKAVVHNSTLYPAKPRNWPDHLKES